MDIKNESNFIRDVRQLEFKICHFHKLVFSMVRKTKKMTPYEFIKKWQYSDLNESSASQSHFIDLCRLLDVPTPTDVDPKGEWYCFERGVKKESGSSGWADVWKRGCFAWEYKSPGANLDNAFVQLMQYMHALESPPLLIASDMARIHIRTNWTNSVCETYELTFEDFLDGAKRDILKWAMSDPEKLRPGITRKTVTEKAAAKVAELAQGLRDQGHDPLNVAKFANRLVFCMFAEDTGLLTDGIFTKMLKQAHRFPDKFADYASRLFNAMATGGELDFQSISWFNGNIFNDMESLPLSRKDIETTLDAATLDWSEIDPSILGTLFERGLDPDKRAQLGAHYTDSEKIMKIIEPVIVHPLRKEWELLKDEISAKMELSSKQRIKRTRAKYKNQAKQALQIFLERLRTFTVLDPACGSGNFLYLALNALKDIEHQVQIEAEELGLERGFPIVGPANVKGIEINAYAAELARVSVWIGEIQWMRRNGFNYAIDPILKPLDTIECRDAIVNPDGSESEWPKSNVVIGNPPFLGYSFQKDALGQDYTDMMRSCHKGQVPAFADLVCYWFHKAGKLVDADMLERVGFVATNSIRGGKNRIVLDKIVENSAIYNAWADEPWVLEGASVRVSMICFGKNVSGLPIQLDNKNVTRINSDLTSTVDLTAVKRLTANNCNAFIGGMKKGPFDISGEQAREWLSLPANPNGRPNSDVLLPIQNAKDITKGNRNRWVVDFGHAMSEADAALYEAPFTYIREFVKPKRDCNNRADLRSLWWRHDRSGQMLFERLSELRRYIATPRVSKYRLFVWIDSRIYPDSALVAIARDDDTAFGILHSRFHEEWSLRKGTFLGKGNDPRYTPTTTFETFPFPEGLELDIPPGNYAKNPNAIAIAEAARNLVELRNNWLNPPGLVKWLEESVPGYPGRYVPITNEASIKLGERTLTKLYNIRPQWLIDAHEDLDASVAAAYGWNADIEMETVMEALLEMNSKTS